MAGGRDGRGEGWQVEGGELQKYVICDNVLRPVS